MVDPDRRLEDWTAALAHVRSLEAVDADRVAVWGTSCSGGHVIAVARRDPEVRAGISTAPFVDGRAVMAHQTDHLGAIERARLVGTLASDRLLGALGQGPVAPSIVSAPHDGALVDTPGAREGFLSTVPEDATVPNRMPDRVMPDPAFHRPGRDVDGMDVPVHVVTAEGDRPLPPGPMERPVEALPDASVPRVDGARFDVHVDPWVGDVVDRQVGFLLEALVGDG